MRVDPDRRQLHQRRQADGAAHVIGERQEGGAEGAEAVQSEAVDDRAHPVLADAEAEVATRVLALLDVAAVVDVRVRRGREVGRPTDELRDRLCGPLDRLARCLAGRDRIIVGREARHVRVPPVGQLGGIDHLELRSLLGELPAVGVEAGVPLGLELAPPLAAAAEMRQRLVGHVELLVGIPAVRLLRQANLLLAKRRAMRRGGVLLMRGCRSRCANARGSATADPRSPSRFGSPPRSDRAKDPCRRPGRRRCAGRATRTPRSVSATSSENDCEVGPASWILLSS